MKAGEPQRGSVSKRGLLSVLVAAAVLLAGALLYRAGWFDWLGSRSELKAVVEALGPAGPLAIIGLMAIAVVISPLPSAPIAMVAGAMFGPVLGTIYVVAGAEAGAIGAFFLARFAAYDWVRRWGAAQQVLRYLERRKSENWLTFVVFASRLAPFVSFDAVSYAAGVTPLSFWRFALATFFGVLPVSFLLAYGGETMGGYIGANPVLMLMVLGGVTAVPVVTAFLWRTFNTGRSRGMGGPE